MATIDEILIRKYPNKRTVWIPLDSEVASEFQDAEATFSAAQSIATVRVDDKEALARVDEAQHALDLVKERLRESSIKFVFAAVGRKRYEQLVLEHPASKDQLRKAREARADVPDFNEDTFPQALVAASLVEPILSEEDVHKLWDSDNFSISELRSLFMAAIQVNQTWRVVELGKD